MDRKMSINSKHSPIALKHERKKALATARQAARKSRLSNIGVVKISHLVRVEDVPAAREAMAKFTDKIRITPNL